MGTPSNVGWKPCPQGELGRLAARLTGRRRLRLVLGAAAGVGLLAATGLAASAAAGRMPEWWSGSAAPHACQSTAAPATPRCPTPAP
jgi:hypothetical protein